MVKIIDCFRYFFSNHLTSVFLSKDGLVYYFDYAVDDERKYKRFFHKLKNWEIRILIEK